MRRATHFHIETSGEELEVFAEGEDVWVRVDGEERFQLEPDAARHLADALMFAAQEAQEADA